MIKRKHILIGILAGALLWGIHALLLASPLLRTEELAKYTEYPNHLLYAFDKVKLAFVYINLLAVFIFFIWKKQNKVDDAYFKNALKIIFPASVIYLLFALSVSKITQQNVSYGFAAIAYILIAGTLVTLLYFISRYKYKGIIIIHIVFLYLLMVVCGLKIESYKPHEISLACVLLFNIVLWIEIFMDKMIARKKQKEPE